MQLLFHRAWKHTYMWALKVDQTLSIKSAQPNSIIMSSISCQLVTGLSTSIMMSSVSQVSTAQFHHDELCQSVSTAQFHHDELRQSVSTAQFHHDELRQSVRTAQFHHDELCQTHQYSPIPSWWTLSDTSVQPSSIMMSSVSWANAV